MSIREKTQQHLVQYQIFAHSHSCLPLHPTPRVSHVGDALIAVTDCLVVMDVLYVTPCDTTTWTACSVINQDTSFKLLFVVDSFDTPTSV